MFFGSNSTPSSSFARCRGSFGPLSLTRGSCRLARVSDAPLLRSEKLFLKQSLAALISLCLCLLTPKSFGFLAAAAFLTLKSHKINLNNRSIRVKGYSAENEIALKNLKNVLFNNNLCSGKEINSLIDYFYISNKKISFLQRNKYDFYFRKISLTLIGC